MPSHYFDSLFSGQKAPTGVLPSGSGAVSILPNPTPMPINSTPPPPPSIRQQMPPVQQPPAPNMRSLGSLLEMFGLSKAPAGTSLGDILSKERDRRYLTPLVRRGVGRLLRDFNPGDLGRFLAEREMDNTGDLASLAEFLRNNSESRPFAESERARPWESFSPDNELIQFVNALVSSNPNFRLQGKNEGSVVPDPSEFGHSGPFIPV